MQAETSGHGQPREDHGLPATILRESPARGRKEIHRGREMPLLKAPKRARQYPRQSRSAPVCASWDSASTTNSSNVKGRLAEAIIGWLSPSEPELVLCLVGSCRAANAHQAFRHRAELWHALWQRWSRTKESLPCQSTSYIASPPRTS